MGAICFLQRSVSAKIYRLVYAHFIQFNTEAKMEKRCKYLHYKQLNWSISDSNRPPIDCEPIALPDELIPHMYIKNILHFRFYGKGFALSCFLYRSPYSTGQPIRDAACVARRSTASFSRLFTCSISARSSPFFERRPH